MGRLEAAAAAGRTAGKVMVGVIVMLLAAGLLEGFGRQLITDTLVRYGIGTLMLLVGAPALLFFEDRFLAELAEKRSEEHTSELQSLMRISYAVFCLKKNKNPRGQHTIHNTTIYS